MNECYEECVYFFPLFMQYSYDRIIPLFTEISWCQWPMRNVFSVHFWFSPLENIMQSVAICPNYWTVYWKSIETKKKCIMDDTSETFFHFFLVDSKCEYLCHFAWKDCVWFFVEFIIYLFVSIIVRDCEFNLIFGLNVEKTKITVIFICIVIVVLGRSFQIRIFSPAT